MAARLGVSTLDLGTTAVHGTASGSVMLYADGSVGGTWAVSILDDQFTTTVGESVTLEAGGQIQIPISFTPTSAGSQSARLSVWDGMTDALTCSLSGTGSSDPFVDNGLTALDFGVTAVGASEVGVVNVCVPAGVDSITFSYSLGGSGGFSITPSSAAIAGGESGSIVVTFSPSAATTYGDVLTIGYTDANGSQSFTVSLSGEGVATDDDEATDDASTGESASGTGDSTSQRATLYVPTSESLVNLGKAYVLDGATVSQSGFTASSTGHVFFRAAGAATLQANGNAWFQSTSGSTYALAGNNAYFVAGKQVVIGAKSLVGVSAGFFGDLVDANRDTAEAGDPGGVDGLQAGFLGADITFGVIDLLLTGANRWKDWHEYYALKKWEEPGKGFIPYLNLTGQGIWNWLKHWGYVLWTLYQGVSFLVDRALGLPAYSASLNGAAGILMGTPSVTVLTASASTAISSLNTTVLGILGFSVESGYSTSLDSIWGDTLVNAGNTVTAIGAGESKVVSRFADLTFLGATVAIGNQKPEVAQKLPTKKITVDANRKVSLTSGLNVGLEASLAMVSKLKLAGMKVKMASGVNTTIACVAGYKVEMTPTGVSISGQQGELVRLTAASITLGPAAAPILVSAAAVDLGNSTLNVSQSGVTSLGQTVDLL